MKLLRSLLLPLAAAAALASPLAAHATLPASIDKAKLQQLVGQVKDQALRAKLQALLDQHGSATLNRAQLEALARQVAELMKKPQGTGTAPAPGKPAAPPKTLVLYDATSGTAWDKLGMAYAIMLRNLLGGFDAQVDMVPVQQYTPGRLATYDATFYLGTYFDHQLPAAFLADAAAPLKPLVWFKYNIWQLAWNQDYNFTANTGLELKALRGLNAEPGEQNRTPGFFDTVKYKGLDFVKYYDYDSVRNIVNADPDVGVMAITDPARASSLVPVANPKTGETAPYVARSGNFWYVADVPFSFIGPRDRYLVFADLLYDILGVPAPTEHKALIRLEDVGAMVSVDAMKKLSDYLKSRNIPFSVAVIPRYIDGLGTYNGGQRQEVHLSQATNLRTALDYARKKGAEFVMHGFTHQYGAMRNPHTGVSGDDYEFWNIVDNQPVPEDSPQWVASRLDQGIKDMRAAGYNIVAWEAPHYHTSAIAARTASQVFRTTYQRVVYYTGDKPNFWAATGKDFSVGQFYPWVIRKDHYGQYVLPENLGNIEYDIRTMDPTSFYNYTAEDLILNAKYAKAVRGGFASFFFHPFWLEPNLGVPGFEDFKKTIEGITQLGFTWVAPSTLSQR